MILEHPDHEASVSGEVTECFHDLSKWSWSIWDTRPTSVQNIFLHGGGRVHDLQQSRPTSVEIITNRFHDSPK